MRRLALLLVAVLMLAAPIAGQEDGLNLPAELYTLKRDGTIQRIGLGAAGVSDVTPPGALTLDFGLSPDGVWMAYRTDGAVGLYNMRTGEQRPLDTTGASYPPYRGRGQSVAWSPQGDAVAYTTETGLRIAVLDGSFGDIVIGPLISLNWSPDGQFLAAEAENDIWWVYRRQQNSPEPLVLHAALPSSRGTAWVSGSLLMFAPAEGGLFLLDASNANQQTQLADATRRFALPQRRQDGTVAVFGRAQNDTRITETAGYLHQIVATQRGVEVEQIGEESVELSNVQWAPGGRVMVALSGGVLAVVDPVSAQGFNLPLTEVAAVAWGALRLPSVPNMPLTADIAFLGDDGAGVRQVWRLAKDGSAAQPITAHDSSIDSFDIAADGSTVAYVSGETLWLFTPNPDIATPLVTGAGITHPALNAAADQVAYAAPDGVYLVDAAGGEPRRVLEGYSEPAFFDARGALIARLSDGDLAMYTLETGDVQRLGSFRVARPLPDGRLMALGAVSSTQRDGLYVLDPGRAEPVQIFAPPNGTISDAALLASGAFRVIVIRSDGLPAPLRVYDIQPGQGPVSIPVVPYLNDARLSPDGFTLAGFASGAGTMAVYSMVLSAENVITLPARVESIRFVPFS
ncbi:MAG: hypothetical protein H3C32_08655 [Anaerolineae bacterium]|nr:hypothetical protein [Anaerolineae bacterium]MBW7879370.1 hypothetical protein [Anaerolineae bacterium]MDL1914728.1 hypothetical protein [Anaerolineae bacterium CFX4]MEB2364618.1 hypothetical protein [Chloroflexota bacterium]RIK22812.1 MAG: hypothetical protein DCC53_01935 [Chloroflexota bacterium]